MEKREKLGSRLGFIMISAGCAIGCGNVWKFPWLCGQNGGATFIVVYLICLIILGIPVLTMEYSIGRAAQASPVRMYKKLEKPTQKWGGWGYMCLAGNAILMAFYTVVTAMIIRYFVNFLTGKNEFVGYNALTLETSNNVIYLAVVVVITFVILSFNINGGFERITKYMMLALFALLIILAIRSCTLPGAKEGLNFYLVPKLSELSGGTVVAAMNQAFFTLSLGIGSMAIFGSYIGKDHSLMGESITVIALDTFVAICAGLIIFPSCFTYGVEAGAGPALLFDSMATVFCNMAGGRWWGALFFLFMTFAAMSTVLAVCENILAMVRELTGWSRVKGSIICGIGIFILGLTTALGYTIIPFHPFGAGTSFSDFWDFILSNNMLPIGCFIIALFCCYKFGWGWDNCVAEANTGKGLKVKKWMKPFFKYVVPVIILGIYIYGLVTFNWG